MAIVLNGTTGITTPDLNTTAQSTDITTTGDITAVDATLSGGVYLGGTGSANYLDDYEEGTWTPTLGIGTCSGTDAYYTKIGRMVFLRAKLSSISDTSSSGAFAIRGLPFTGVNNEAVLFSSLYVAFTSSAITGGIMIGGTEIYLYKPNSFSQLAHSELTSGATMYFHLAYHI